MLPAIREAVLEPDGKGCALFPMAGGENTARKHVAPHAILPHLVNTAIPSNNETIPWMPAQRSAVQNLTWMMTKKPRQPPLVSISAIPLSTRILQRDLRLEARLTANFWLPSSCCQSAARPNDSGLFITDLLNMHQNCPSATNHFTTPNAQEQLSILTGLQYGRAPLVNNLTGGPCHAISGRYIAEAPHTK